MSRQRLRARLLDVALVGAALVACGPVGLSAQSRPALYASRTHVALYAGMTKTTLRGSGSENPDWNWGYHGGAFVVLPVTSRLAFRTGLAYAQKGAHVDQPFPGSNIRFELAYLEMPALARVTVLSVNQVAAYAFGGVTVGLRTGCQYRYSVRLQFQFVSCETSPNTIPVKSFDVTAAGGAGVTMTPREGIGLVIEVTHQRGLGTIDASPQPLSVKHQAWKLGLGFALPLGKPAH